MAEARIELIKAEEDAETKRQIIAEHQARLARSQQRSAQEEQMFVNTQQDIEHYFQLNVGDKSFAHL